MEQNQIRLERVVYLDEHYVQYNLVLLNEEPIIKDIIKNYFIFF
jgi:predicted transcriptional regulator